MTYTGVVLEWKSSFGFIRPDNSEMDDVFVHYSNIEPNRKGFKELSKGQSVKFEICGGRKGPEACNVVIHDEDRKSKFGRESENAKQ